MLTELKSKVKLLKKAVHVVQLIVRIGAGSDGRVNCDMFLKMMCNNSQISFKTE
jgi:hypothetical protein